MESTGAVACSTLGLPEDWPTAHRVPLMSELALEASALARSRNLRGPDAVQLASAAMLAREVRGVWFLSFDERLSAAVRGVVRVWGE